MSLEFLLPSHLHFCTKQPVILVSFKQCVKCNGGFSLYSLSKPSNTLHNSQLTFLFNNVSRKTSYDSILSTPFHKCI